MKPRRVVETSDNWHGSQRLSSIKLGTDRALNKYKKKKTIRKDSVLGGCVIGLKRADDASNSEQESSHETFSRGLGKIEDSHMAYFRTAGCTSSLNIPIMIYASHSSQNTNIA